MHMEEAAVSVKGLVKRYGSVTAVDGISFEVKKGEVFGLLGPNGAGKTTTFECMEGLRTADDGVIRVAGCDPVRQQPLLRKQYRQLSTGQKRKRYAAVLRFLLKEKLPYAARHLK
jgi:ABC-type multidrug transport system ATPase subunit